MARKLPPHHRFPKDNRIWRLTWFGDVHFNPSVPTEPTIEVLLAPLIDSRVSIADIDEPAAYDQSHSVAIEVGIGYLPSLRIGTFWRNGLPYNLPQGKPRYVNATIHTPTDIKARATLTNTCGFIPKTEPFEGKYEPKDYIGRTVAVRRDFVEYRDYFIPESQYSLRIGGRLSNATGVSRSKVLRFMCDVTGRIKNGNSITTTCTVIIPCAEILRFYYASSTALAREIISGGAGISIYDTHNTLFNPNPDLTCRNDETGKAFIQLRRRMRDADAANIARIRFDDYAYAQTRGIYDSVLKNRSDNGQSSSVEAYPPFTQSTVWTALGKEFEFGFRERERQFLVYELLTCAAPFPFSELWFDRDNDGRSQVNPETPEEYFAKLEAYKNIVRDVDRISSDEPQGSIINDNEPSRDYPEYEVINDAVRFPDLLNKEVKKLPQSRTTHRAAQNKTRPDPTEEPNSYSTGEGSYEDVTTAPFAVTLSGLDAIKGDEVEEADLKDKRRQNSAIPADFDEFTKMLDELGCFLFSEWSFIQVVPDDADVLSGGRSVFPLQLYKNDENKLLNWSFIDAETMEQRRQALIAELKYESRHYYLLEAEHRPDVDKAGKRKEKFAMLLLTGNSGDGKITIEELTDVLENCVSHRAVQLYDDELTFLRHLPIKHTSHSNKQTAKRVFEEIKNIQRDF